MREKLKHLKEKVRKLGRKRAIIFKSTEFGDDKDRALQKEDKSWTYFASDVAYHNTKLKRNFNVLINILVPITLVILKELLL